MSKINPYAKYNAHTGPIFKSLFPLELEDSCKFINKIITQYILEKNIHITFKVLSYIKIQYKFILYLIQYGTINI